MMLVVVCGFRKSFLTSYMYMYARLLYGFERRAGWRGSSEQIVSDPLCRILLHPRTLAGNFAPEAVRKL